jgi:hypothetical protein
MYIVFYTAIVVPRCFRTVNRKLLDYELFRGGHFTMVYFLDEAKQNKWIFEIHLWTIVFVGL